MLPGWLAAKRRAEAQARRADTEAHARQEAERRAETEAQGRRAAEEALAQLRAQLAGSRPSSADREIRPDATRRVPRGQHARRADQENALIELKLRCGWRQRTRPDGKP